MRDDIHKSYATPHPESLRTMRRERPTLETPRHTHTTHGTMYVWPYRRGQRARPTQRVRPPSRRLNTRASHCSNARDEHNTAAQPHNMQ